MCRGDDEKDQSSTGEATAPLVNRSHCSWRTDARPCAAGPTKSGGRARGLLSRASAELWPREDVYCHANPVCTDPADRACLPGTQGGADPAAGLDMRFDQLSFTPFSVFGPNTTATFRSFTSETSPGRYLVKLVMNLGTGVPVPGGGHVRWQATHPLAIVENSLAGSPGPMLHGARRRP
jgi:hypothetical protein